MEIKIGKLRVVITYEPLWMDQVKAHLGKGERLMATKLYRDKKGVDLRTAKFEVDKLLPKYYKPSNW